MPFGDFTKRRFQKNNLADRVAKGGSKLDDVARKRISIRSLDDLNVDLGHGSAAQDNVFYDENGLGIREGSAGGKPGQYSPHGVTFYDENGNAISQLLGYLNGGTGYRYLQSDTVVPNDGTHKAYNQLRVLDSSGNELAFIRVTGDGEIVIGPKSGGPDMVIDVITGNITTPGTITATGDVSAPNVKGYVVHVLAALQATLTDGQTVYWGGMPAAPSTSAATSRIYITKAGTIKAAYISVYASTAGSNENWSMYIRLNNSSDTLIETEASNGNFRLFGNTSLDIPVSVGDYIEIKEVHPTWSTNPANVVRGGYLYIE